MKDEEHELRFTYVPRSGAWTDDELETRFTYVPPKEGQPEKYQEIRAYAKAYAYLLKVIAPESRELSLAITKLEEVVFWANAAIARREEI